MLIFEPLFNILNSRIMPQRLFPEDGIFPQINFFPVTRYPIQKRSEMNQGFETELIDWRAIFAGRIFVKATNSLAGEIFLPQNLFAPASFPGDKLPEKFGSHS